MSESTKKSVEEIMAALRSDSNSNNDVENPVETKAHENNETKETPSSNDSVESPAATLNKIHDEKSREYEREITRKKNEFLDRMESILKNKMDSQQLKQAMAEIVTLLGE